MNCCPSDVRMITKVAPGGAVTVQYLDLRVSPPVVLTQAEYDAITKVKCPEVATEWSDVFLQPNGNTDPALIVSGQQMYVTTTTFADEAGTVATVSRAPSTLFLADGTDVTATHEIVTVPATQLTSADDSVTLTVIAGGYDLSVDLPAALQQTPDLGLVIGG